MQLTTRRPMGAKMADSEMSNDDEELPVVAGDGSQGPRDFDNIDEPPWLADVIDESGLTKPRYIEDYETDESVVAAIGSEKDQDRWMVSDTFVTIGADDFTELDDDHPYKR